MKQYILFDFDGVIFDSCAMVNRHVLTHWGHDEAQQQKNHEGNVYARDDMTESDDARAAEEKSIAGFFCDYENDMHGCALYNGMENVLRRALKDFDVYIVSSTPSVIIDAVLSRCGVRECVTGIYGMDVDRSKEKKIGMICERTNASPTDYIFVTDTLGDILEARAAGIDAIGVTWGIHDRERLAKGNPWAILSSVDDVIPSIHRYFYEHSGTDS